MRALALDTDAPSGSALIVCLCRAGRLDTAVAVYEDMLAVAWRRELSLKGIKQAAAGAGDARARAQARRALSKRAQVPDGEALAELAQTFAAKGELRQAFKYYNQLRRDPVGLVGATVTHRRAFELLIENDLRQRNVRRALAVFEDWKAASSTWLTAQRPAASAAERGGGGSTTGGAKAAGSNGGTHRGPRLSYVTLAFLEACCRHEPEHAWRVYDVLAVIRQQRERKAQAELARPRKESHHVLGSLN